MLVCCGCDGCYVGYCVWFRMYVCVDVGVFFFCYWKLGNCVVWGFFCVVVLVLVGLVWCGCSCLLVVVLVVVFCGFYGICLVLVGGDYWCVGGFVWWCCWYVWLWLCLVLVVVWWFSGRLNVFLFVFFFGVRNSNGDVVGRD